MAFSITLTGEEAFAPEEGTRAFDIVFYDDDDNPVTPKTLTKTLQDLFGTVINSIDKTAVGGLANEMTFVLSGDDLGIPTASSLGRVFTLLGTYDSGLGSDLPLNLEVFFSVKPMVGVT